MSVQKRIEQAWYQGAAWTYCLFPLAIIFAFITAIRRACYRWGILSSSKPPIPVIVVGNLSVGGNGKTPVVLALCEYLSSLNRKVGVLSRGYGGMQRQFPYCVSPKDSAELVGDEPALMARRVNCNVVIDPNRQRGADYLFQMGCDIIVCDDGLQHYALKRDIEWVVMDERLTGNGFLLPMGPLREGIGRLKSVDGVIVNGNANVAMDVAYVAHMSLHADQIVNVGDPSLRMSVEEFKQRYSNVTAACAIGNPQRFYQTLSALTVNVSQQKEFPDHHQFTPDDLPPSALIMTEKDAVKCAPFAHPDWWYLRVSASLPDSFYNRVKQLVSHADANTVRKINGI
ncbi:tetraacyldisaccharide 4'-kinase [Alteromonas facilis]|uniref:tetraacyldisaccharide 4'-kinase n=1 Tax=Alteromonas facilis TaxID=2048004 RepID=UPI000C286BDD|nr:tetraacyldisaccharide 4'-kinase [Alteromonas facilis]